MRTLLPSRRRPRPPEEGVTGTTRVDRRTPALLRRLRPGDVAVVDILDLDVVTANALLARRPVAVLNASPSSSGRYPNLGPRVLVEAGVVLVDDLGPDLLNDVVDGRSVQVLDGQVLLLQDRDGKPRLVAEGLHQTPGTVAETTEAAREGMAAQLDAFAASTSLFLTAERDLLLEGVGVPDLALRIEGRPALVVVRGYGYADDLHRLRRFVAERRPVLIGVDGGADALLEARMRPDVVVADVEQVSDQALTCGAEVVAHTRRDSPEDAGLRLGRLGLSATTFGSGLTTEDTAILLAHAHGASTVVTVGSHATLEEFLDRGRAGMASSFLSRLRVGNALVDAATVADLHQPRMSWWPVVLLVVVGLLALAAAVAVTPWGQDALAPVTGTLGGLVEGLAPSPSGGRA